METPLEKGITSIYIKDMVCPCCIRIIKEQFARMKLPLIEVKLGQVDLVRPLKPGEREKVKAFLEDYGFKLLESKRAKLVEKIKNLLIDLIHYKREKITSTYSDYLSKAIGKDYSTLSHAFSSVEKITIEKYIILQKIKFIKAQLNYEELSLREIASQLHYKSLSHISQQFKSVTGYTPSEYKKLPINDRLALGQIK